MAENRVKEAKKLGFTTCIIPYSSLESVREVKGIKVIGVKSVRDAIDLL